LIKLIEVRPAIKRVVTLFWGLRGAIGARERLGKKGFEGRENGDRQQSPAGK
jgi:hypothetical protein